MPRTNVIWFYNDYRLDDHPALSLACESSHPLVAIAFFPMKHITSQGLSTLSDARASLLHQALASLQQDLENAGIPLLVTTTPHELKHHLEPTSIDTVYYHDALGPTATTLLKELQEVLSKTTFHGLQGRTMLHPSDLPFTMGQTPEVFTSFRKQVENQPVVRRPLPRPQIHQELEERYSLPSLESLGYKETFLLVPSTETLAQERLKYYCIDSQHVLRYKETRNGMLAWDDSSKLSVHLSLGTLSARRVYAVLKEAEARYEANESTYWLWFELLWRDFFYFTHEKQGKDFLTPWSTEALNQQQQAYFETISRGETGYPLVDANMKELIKTGWMSNRGRQNVASFFVHYCGLPWSLGAQLFEMHLLDYDVSSNTGNWKYIAGVGNDPREQRVFNVMKQGQTYDPSTAYLLRWLPELSNVRMQDRYRLPLLPDSERRAANYPSPIVGVPWS
jgi:deoxyribodipyrimidine photo-lyase